MFCGMWFSSRLFRSSDLIARRQVENDMPPERQLDPAVNDWSSQRMNETIDIGLLNSLPFSQKRLVRLSVVDWLAKLLLICDALRIQPMLETKSASVCIVLHGHMQIECVRADLSRKPSSRCITSYWNAWPIVNLFYKSTASTTVRDLHQSALLEEPIVNKTSHNNLNTSNAGWKDYVLRNAHDRLKELLSFILGFTKHTSSLLYQLIIALSFNF